MKPKDWNHILLKALADELNPSEKEDLELELARNADLRQEWKQLRETQELLGAQAFRLEPFLAGRVMQRIKNEEAILPEFGLQKAFKALVLPVFALVMGLVIFTYVQEDQLTLEALSGTTELQVEQAIASEWTGLGTY